MTKEKFINYSDNTSETVTKYLGQLYTLVNSDTILP